MGRKCGRHWLRKRRNPKGERRLCSSFESHRTHATIDALLSASYTTIPTPSYPQVPANLLLVKNLSLHGVYWGSYAAHAPAILRDSLEAALLLWLQGRRRLRDAGEADPTLIFDLADAGEAFRALISRRAVGKVLLAMEGPRGSRARL